MPEIPGNGYLYTGEFITLYHPPMKKITSSGYINTTLHVLIWGALLLLPWVVSNAQNDYRIGVMPGLFFSITVLIHMAIFYGNAFYLYPGFFNRRYWWLYIPVSILLIGGSFQLKYFVMAAWFPGMLKYTAGYKFVFAPSVGVFIISIIYRRIVDGIRAEREQKEKQAAQLLTELKFLRSQVSPHFLFNVLTNLVSLARKKSDRLEPSLIMLSDLMRYMLYDAQGKRVALRKEIEYLHSYIALQQLRFGNEVQVDSRIETGDAGDHYEIEPMLLIPFVENAFKHGAGYNGHPQINIHLSVNNGWLLFEVKNRFDEEPAASKDENAGIGLSNVKSRLQLLYRDSHTLTINNTNNLFHIVLTLKLL